MRIKLLHQVGDDPKGAVLEIDERRAKRLVRTGYAEEAPVEKPARREKEK